MVWIGAGIFFLLGMLSFWFWVRGRTPIYRNHRVMIDLPPI